MIQVFISERLSKLQEQDEDDGGHEQEGIPVQQMGVSARGSSINQGTGAIPNGTLRPRN